MGLAEVKEDLKKQLAEMGDKPEEQEEEVVIEQPAEEVKQEEKTDEKPEEKQETKSEKTNAEYARERRERLKEKRENDELRAARERIKELEQLVVKPKEESRVEEVAPNRQDDPAAYAEWEARQAKKEAREAAEIARKATEKVEKQEREQRQQALRNQAQEELIGFEDQFRKVANDYDDVKNYYINTLAFSIKQLNPKITNKALAEAVTNQVMIRASQLMNDGYENPIEALYEEIKSNGYRPSVKEEAEDKKPDLTRVATNRSRNAGTAGASSGTGRGELTKVAATKLTIAEWAKVPKHERERLMRSM